LSDAVGPFTSHDDTRRCRYASGLMEAPRWTLGKMQNPVRGFLHGTSAVLALLATVFLAWQAPNWGIRFGAVVFGLAMVALYTTSSLYHAIPWRDVWKRRMQRVDHFMILVLIAGTYTPVAVATLDGPLRWIVLGVAWGTVAIGALQHAFFPREKQNFSMILAISMGWLGVFIGWKFVQELGWVASGLALLGGQGSSPTTRCSTSWSWQPLRSTSSWYGGTSYRSRSGMSLVV